MGCEGEDWDLLFMGTVTGEWCTVLLNNEIINIYDCIKCIYAELFRLQTAQMCISFCLLNLNKWIFYQEVEVVLYCGAKHYTKALFQYYELYSELAFSININRSIWKMQQSKSFHHVLNCLN